MKRKVTLFVSVAVVAVLILVGVDSTVKAASTNLTYYKSLDLIKKVLELVKKYTR